MTRQIMWVARCENYTSKRYPTQGQADRKRREIDHMGNCPLEHEVVSCVQDEHHVWRDDNGKMVP